MFYFLCYLRVLIYLENSHLKVYILRNAPLYEGYHILATASVLIWLLPCLRTHTNTVHPLHVLPVVLSQCAHISRELTP